MGEIYLDEQSEADTPSTGEVVVYPKTDGKVYAKGDDGVEQTLTNESSTSNVYKMAYKNANYTMDLAVDGTIITYQTTDITITIPLSSTIPNDGHGREFIIINLGSTGSVTVAHSGTETMSNGLSQCKVNYKENYRFAGAYPTLGQGWVRTGILHRNQQLRISSGWDESNFDGTWGSIPWDVEDANDDDNVFDWSSTTNPERLTVLSTGRFNISVFGTCNSTGGSSYSVDIRILKNGTDVIDGSEQYCANYQREDSMLVIAELSVDLETDDYLEIQLNHSNLTGNALNFVTHFKTTV